MITRREALQILASMSAGTLLRSHLRTTALTQQGDPTPTLAPGAPMSAERRALIDAFKAKSEAVVAAFEPHTFTSDFVMPYRLFRPKAGGKLPLVVYLHGSGGLGTDNEKQMGLGNIFGTRLWALSEHQKAFPSFVLVPQTDRGWMRYGPPAAGDSIARPVPGLGDGARVALELIEALRKELPIDERRIYLTGQSMGGGGAWNMLAQRPGVFAAAAICCGSESFDDVSGIRTPVWNFHGDADTTVSPSISRTRIAAMRKAGAHPLSTEYAGVGHNAWEWAYTEPSLIGWMYSKRLGG